LLYLSRLIGFQDINSKSKKASPKEDFELILNEKKLQED